VEGITQLYFPNMSFKLKNLSDGFAVSRVVALGTAASIARGVPTKETGTAGGVAVMADGEGTTSQRFSGIAKGVSTETAAVAGSVPVWHPFPGVIYEGKPKVAGAANTQAEIDALKGVRTVFDLTSTVWSIDAAASDSANNCVVIVDGRAQDDVLYFVVSPEGQNNS
jgi:hypothetical protein